MLNLKFIFFYLLFFNFLAYAKEVKPQNQVEWKVVYESSHKELAGIRGFATGYINESFFIVGGKKPDQEDSFSDLILRLTYSPKIKSFTTTATGRLHAPVANAGVGFSKTEVIVAGGINSKGLVDQVVKIRWDIKNRKIIQINLPSLPIPVRDPFVVILNDIVYIGGGDSVTGTIQNFYCFNLSDTKSDWKRLPDIPVGHVKSAFVQYSGTQSNIYISTIGSSDPLLFDQHRILLFDIAQQRWSEVEANTPDHIYNSGCVAVGSTYALLLQKGENESTKNKFFEYYIYLFNTITNRISPLNFIPDTNVIATKLIGEKDNPFLITVKNDKLYIQQGVLIPSTYFSFWDYLVLIGYLISTVLIGLLLAGKQKSTSDYFKGGGKIPAWAVGVSILGTHLSAITFMSVPAKTYATNWNYFFLMMSVVLVFPIVNKYFIPFYKGLNLTTAYEYLHKRFNYSVRAMASMLYILLQVGRLAIVLLLPSIALTVVTGINVYLSILLMGIITLFYTFKGGIKAVIWTDVMQVFVLFGGALFCLFYIPSQLPGSINELYNNLAVNGKFEIFNSQFDLETPNFWVVIIGGFAINFLTYSTDQTTVQRYLTTKDERAAKMSSKIGALTTVPAGLIFLTIGSLLYLFYSYYPESVNLTLNSHDSIFPWFIVSQLPAGLTGLLIAGIFAAAMSSLSSSLNSVSTAFVTDFYKIKFKNASDQKYLQVAKITTLFIGILTISISTYMAKDGIISLWDQFNKILGLFTGGIGGVFLLGIFTKRANVVGAIAGLIISGIWQLIILNYTSINFLLYAFSGLVMCFLSGYIVSLFFGTKNIQKELTIYESSNDI